MKIVPLNCPNCGKRLEIGENKEQLACGTCGSQLFVDRSGGTISLELAKSLGAMSTGATQTAAELALVRLEKERKTAFFRVSDLELKAKRTKYYKEQEIMSEVALVATNERVKTLPTRIKMLETEKEQVGIGCGWVIASGVIFFVACLFAANYLGSMLWLIPFGFIAFCLMGGVASITESIMRISS